MQLSLTLAALSLGLWWTFDRSRSGFGLGITTAFLATVITQLLVYNGVYQYVHNSFYVIKSYKLSKFSILRKQNFFFDAVSEDKS